MLLPFSMERAQPKSSSLMPPEGIHIRVVGADVAVDDARGVQPPQVAYQRAQAGAAAPAPGITPPVHIMFLSVTPSRYSITR